MRDDRVDLVSRQISRLHVLEEARQSVSQGLPRRDVADSRRRGRATVRSAAAVLVADVVSLSLNPDVFAHLQIDNGAEIAQASPHHRANVIAGLAKLTSFLTDLGVIDEAEPWIELGLIAGNSRP